ncbi:hypothetical protein SDJN03_12645, partial [Cucurbita argyrosperma subsp. sororia]
MGIEPGISGFVDQRLIHWAMESYDREAWAADSIPEAWAEGLIHLSIFKRKTIDKNDSTGDRTQSLWFRRPAPYPLGHGVVRPPAPYPSGHGVDRKAWAAGFGSFLKGKQDKNDSTGDRTQNLWFRRPAPYPLGHGIIRQVTGFVDQRLIHWAMKSYDRRAWAALISFIHFSTLKLIDKDDSTGDRTQSLWFRRPAPYPLGHGVDRKAWAAGSISLFIFKRKTRQKRLHWGSNPKSLVS